MMNKEERQKAISKLVDPAHQVEASITNKVISIAEEFGSVNCFNERGAIQWKKLAKKYFKINLQKQGKVLTLKK